MISELDSEHIEVFLETKHVARLGCHADGRTFVVPITYVYEDGCVYGHTNEGMKVRMMRKNPEVCVEVDQIDTMAQWRSVIAWGRFEELSGQDEVAALDLLYKRLQAGETSETSVPGDHDDWEEFHQKIKMKPTKGVTYRIKLTEKTGRFETKG